MCEALHPKVSKIESLPLLLWSSELAISYTFTVAQPISELLHFFSIVYMQLHVQEQHVTTLFGIYFTVVNGA